LVYVELSIFIGKCCKTFEDRFLNPFLGSCLKYIQDLFNRNFSTDIEFAFLLIDEILEANFMLTDVGMIKKMLKYCKPSSTPGIRQSTAYGLKLVAKSKILFSKYFKKSLNVLEKVIADSEAKKSPNIYATDNAITSFGYIIDIHATGAERELLFKKWATLLPSLNMDGKGDTEEAHNSYELFCNSLKKEWIPNGLDPKYIPSILFLLNSALKSFDDNESLCEKITETIKMFK